MNLPVKNEKYFYKNGPRYVNKHQNEMIYLTGFNCSESIQDYHYKKTILREGIVISWNYKVFENE